MRVAITAIGPSLSADIDPRFGRCPYLLLVETDDMTFEAIENSHAALGGGAGIQAAQDVAHRGARAVLTGHCGPNAYTTLSAAGIEVFTGCSGSAGDALARFKVGALRPSAAPTVSSHAGLAGGQ